MWRSGRLAAYPLRASPAGRRQHGTLAPGVTQVAVSFTRRGEPAVLAAVAAQPARSGPLSREVVRACAAAGVRLRRLDGEQAPAAYATAPTATPPARRACAPRPARR